MGSRKHTAAVQRKEALKSTYFAKLNNCPTSPRKMRLVADMIRGKKVDLALNLLRYTKKEAAEKLEKLLLSALANWQNKNEGVRIEDQELYISKIFVDGGRVLKRLRPAPQGRGHRVRKRSNHVSLYIDSKNAKPQAIAETTAETTTENIEA